MANFRRVFVHIVVAASLPNALEWSWRCVSFLLLLAKRILYTFIHLHHVGILRSVPLHPPEVERYLTTDSFDTVRPSSKRTITVLGALLTIITIAFYLHKNVDTSLSRSIWQPSQFLFPACTPRNRTNPWHIKGPSSVDPNQEALQEYWHNLKALFDTHPPSPIAVERTGGPEELKANGVKFNADGYPSVDFLGKLFNITDEDAEKTRQAHKSVMHGLAEYPTEETFQGRGIVTLAGGKYAEFAATSLGVLRELGSQLPVEVWVRDESEERAGWCAELAAEGMTCRRLSDYMELTALENPYQWKVFTILLSSFEHILFLDADSIFLKAPDDIFDDKVYLENGAILWPDYWKHTGSPRLPYIIGDSPHQHDSSWLLQNRTVDSGQILWNKKQHWQVRIQELSEKCIMNSYSFISRLSKLLLTTIITDLIITTPSSTTAGLAGVTKTPSAQL